MKYSCYQDCSVIHGWFVYCAFCWQMHRLSKSLEIRFRMASFSKMSLLTCPCFRRKRVEKSQAILEHFMTFRSSEQLLSLMFFFLVSWSRAYSLCGLSLYTSIPWEQRLHFRGMRWRAKSSLCRQPFNFLSCMRKIRHAIRKQLVRQICVSFAGIKIAKTTCEQLSSSFCFVFLLCPSGFKYFSRKISSDRLLREHYATNCSKSCLIWGEHI